MDDIQTGAEQQGADAEAVTVNDQATGDQNQDSAEQSQEQLIDVPGVGKLTLKEVQDGYMRQADYTRKTQEIAALKHEPAPQQNLDPYADPVEARLKAQEQETQRLVGYIGKLEGERLIGDINQDPKYKGVFKDESLRDTLLAVHMQKGRGADLKKTADELFKTITKLQVETKQATEQQVVKNLNSPTRRTPPGVGTMAPPKDFDPAKASWKDIDKVAASML